LLDESVVATPGQDGVLASQVAGHELKGRTLVVVQSADEEGILLEINVKLYEVLPDIVEMFVTLVAEVVKNGRNDLGVELSAGLVLAVQGSEGVLVQPTVTVLAEIIPVGFEDFNEFLHVLRPTARTTDGIQQKTRFPDPGLSQESIGEVDQFRVDQGVPPTEDFGSDLVKLPEPSALGSLVAEHGSVVEKLELVVAGEQLVLDHRTNHAGRILGTEGDNAVAGLLDGVHFLGHNVGTRSQRSIKQGRVLENGGFNLSKPGSLEDIPMNLDQFRHVLPGGPEVILHTG
jgi:hypothetical protein